MHRASNDHAERATDGPNRETLSPYHRRAFRVFTVAAVAFTVVAVALFSAAPALRPALVQEDHFLENFSIGLYGVALIVALYGCARRGCSVVLVVLGLLAVVGIGEEMSWGERLLGWTPVEVAGTRIDAGHDVVVLAARAARDWIVEAPATATVVLLGTTLLATVLIRRSWPRFVAMRRAVRQRVLRRPSLGFALLCVALGLAAVVLDLVAEAIHGVTRTGHDYVEALEETLETLAALALTFGAVVELTRLRTRRELVANEKPH